MTDMLHKPLGWDAPLNQMTEEERKEYFRLREELDVEYSKEDMIVSLNKVNQLLASHNEKEAYVLMKKIPMFPRQAYKSKKCLGIKSVMNFNLSQAKKEYPNEF